MGGDDDGLAGFTGPCHSVPEQAPGHRVHAIGWLIQEYDRRLSKQGNASAQLPLVTTTGVEGVKEGTRLIISMGSLGPSRGQGPVIAESPR